MEEVLQARSLPVPAKKISFSFWKDPFNILYVEQNSQPEAAFQEIQGMLLVTAL